MTDVYRGVADAPPVQPPRYSLLTAATVVDEPTLRWQGGYDFLSELGGKGGAEGLEGCLQWYTSNDPLDAYLVHADPVQLWAQAPCTTTLGARTRDWQGPARRLLRARQSEALARWLAYNRLNAAATNGPQSVLGGAAEVVAALEDYLARMLDGPLGTLHCSPGTLAGVVGAGLARLDGARWVTPIGTPIVADAGYTTDTGLLVEGTEAGAIIATGPVRVRLGPIELPDAERAAEWIDPRTNTVHVVASRTATVEWDPGSPDGLVSTPPDVFAPVARGGVIDFAASSGTPG
jgi:hypothetical protein